MDALQMLREDHRKVKELFRQFEEAQDKATKKAVAETALVELNIHSVIEEEIFYPAFRRQGNGSGEIVERAEQEHHTADQLMDELMKMEPGNQEFDAKFHVLIENVKSHIDEEEAEMLPQAAEAGLARMDQLGQRMEQRRNELLSGPSAGGQRPRSTVSTRTQSTAGTSRTTGTRKRSTTGARSKATTRTRTRASAGTRSRGASTNGSRATTGTRKATGRSITASRRASGTRSTKTGARSASLTTAQRPTSSAAAKTRTAASSSRTVKQAAGTRTTKTRSNTGGRRSGSQSGR